MTSKPSTLLALALAAFAADVPARAQDPADAKLFPAGYLDHGALTAALRKAAEANPGRVAVRSLGKSVEGRDVWLATVGGPEAGKPATKPAVLVVANLEADHVVGSQVALKFVETLAAAKGKDADWLDRVTLYIVPRLNPDGAERLLKGSPAAEIRGNLRPLDRDRDGKAAEDGPDDLDGDGVVTRVRFKDPVKPTLMPDEKDPRILRKADPAKGERAEYSEEPEGKDDDGDGPRNEDPPGGVNINRNWPHKWTEFDLEAGSSPASEPETRALIAFAFEHPEIAAVWSLGLNDNLRDEPKKPGSDLDDADLPVVVALSKAYRKAALPKDPPKGSPAPGATSDGAFSEWAYHQLGAVGLASRVWSVPEVPAPPAAKEADAPKGQEKAKDKDKEKEPAKPPAVPEDGEARWLYWNDKVVGGRAFVPFRSFDHPTLGKVEIGGWRPGVRLNPPSGQVGAIADAHFAFLSDLAGRLPRLAVPVLEVEAKGGGVFAVRAVVENQGELPTALAQGVKTRRGLPVLVRLDPAGADLKVLSGKALERIDALPGSGGRREFRWLLLAPKGLGRASLAVSCPRAGRVVMPLARP